VVLPIVIYPDPEAVVKTRIETACADRDETYRPTTVSVEFPGKNLTGIHAQVVHDAPSPDDSYPAKERDQVRVVLWGPQGRRSDVKDAASLVLGLLCATDPADGNGTIRKILGRSAVSTDPDTKYLMCWFLVRVNLRGTQLPT
jgi:hypothetical protein